MTTGSLVGLIALMAVLIGLGQPVFIVLGAVAGYLLLQGGVYAAFHDLANIVEMTRRLADNDVLLAIPFFVMAGAVMTEGDIAKRLIAFARACFGWLPGGLAISATFACVLFAAISGSSPVTVIAIGSIMFPAMVAERYTKRFSSGLVTSAGSLGILIPPSIPMIVYAIADPTQFAEPERGRIAADGADLGVTDLFLAGVGPGLLIALIFSAFAIVEGLRREIPRSPFSFAEIGRTAAHGVWALLLPVVVLGGIYSGAFTATNAACVALVYAIVVERYLHRSITFLDLKRVFADATVLIGALLLILALAQGFTTYLYRAGVAEAAARQLYEWNLGPVAFLLIVNLLLLVVGMFMDILSAILILVPLLAPIGHQLGVHPLHLGVIFIVNLEIGYLTPPLGINLFVASTLFKRSLGDIIRGVLPFTALMLVALAIITYVPTVSLGLVSLFHDGDLDVPFPEPHIPMDGLGVPESIQLLAGLAPEEEEEPAPTPGPGAAGGGQVLSMAELMAQATTQMEEEGVAGLQYDSLAAMLADYRAVADGNLRLRDLILRGGGEEPGGDEPGDGEPEGPPPSE